MMIGHLTVAGLAEMVVSAGVVAYLQRAEPSLLRNTAPGAAIREGEALPLAGGWSATRPLWTALAVLMILTPLGILAAGSAWGEWSPEDFSNQASRHQMAITSGSQVPPAQAPAGLQHLASFWTAPMPRYAPPFLKSPTFGYMLSAVSGTGLIILVFLLAGWISSRRQE
jgi:cobalt/nickel transport system permease protein